MIKVLIVNENPVIRRRLRLVLGEAFDIAVTGEVSAGTEVLNEVARHDLDVILLDISISDGKGLEILHQLHREKPELHVLMLSDYCEEQYVTRVLFEGASGFLAKDSASEELIPAIRQVASGKRFVTSALPAKWSAGTEPNRDKHEP
jgi:DNA-binding NarL/FixJ family response regulator